MLKQVHDHITSELRQNARTDTIFVVTAIAFNLIVLGINSGVASEAASDYAESSSDVILMVFIIDEFDHQQHRGDSIELWEENPAEVDPWAVGDVSGQ